MTQEQGQRRWRAFLQQLNPPRKFIHQESGYLRAINLKPTVEWCACKQCYSQLETLKISQKSLFLQKSPITPLVATNLKFEDKFKQKENTKEFKKFYFTIYRNQFWEQILQNSHVVQILVAVLLL